MKNILLIVVIPITIFAALMIIFPRYRAMLFAAEIASPIPPIP